MFAFCPMVNHRICGISEDFDNNDMTLYATEEVKTLQTDDMVYRPSLTLELIEEDPDIQRAFDFCHYQITNGV